MARLYYLIKATKRGTEEEYAIEQHSYYCHQLQEECDALNDSNEVDWIEYFVSQYKPEDMP